MAIAPQNSKINFKNPKPITHTATPRLEEKKKKKKKRSRRAELREEQV
jgi:hypothetical protein